MLFATLAYCHFVLIPLEEAWLQDTHPELFEEHIKTGAPRPLKRPALLLQYIVLNAGLDVLCRCQCQCGLSTKAGRHTRLGSVRMLRTMAQLDTMGSCRMCEMLPNKEVLSFHWSATG
jgi:hypothetical protein